MDYPQKWTPLTSANPKPWSSDLYTLHLQPLQALDPFPADIDTMKRCKS